MGSAPVGLPASSPSPAPNKPLFEPLSRKLHLSPSNLWAVPAPRACSGHTLDSGQNVKHSQTEKMLGEITACVLSQLEMPLILSVRRHLPQFTTSHG